MTLAQYREAVQAVHDEAEKALWETDDFERHMLWARLYHKLASECLAKFQVELRPDELGNFAN